MVHRVFALLLAAVLMFTTAVTHQAGAFAPESGDTLPGTPAADASDSIRIDLIDGGTIYAGGLGGRIVALDAASGDERWTYQTLGPLAIVHLIDAGTVIATSHRVIPNSTSLEPVTFIVALDAATGLERWSTTWEVEATVVGTSGGRLLLHSVRSPVAIVTPDDLESDTGLIALDLATGERDWLGPIVYHALIPPTEPDTVYAVLPVTGEATFDVAALDAATGFERWRASVGSRAALRVVALDEERLYVATGQVETMLSSGRGGLWAIDRATGSVLWAAMTGGRGIAGNDLALGDDLVILASSDIDGRNSAIAGIDLLSGETRWTLPLPGYVHSGATLAGGLALAGNATPDEPNAPAAAIHALDPETGRLVWDVPAASIWAGVVAAQDDTAYVIARWTDADPEQLLALDLETGALVWQREIAGSGDVVGLADGVLYVTGDRDVQAVSDLHVYVGDDELSALDARTGAVIWTRSAAVNSTQPLEKQMSRTTGALGLTRTRCVAGADARVTPRTGCSKTRATIAAPGL